MSITFFETPAAFGKWLAKNHATVTELWVGFYKKSSGRPSITWPESVDEALCYGWIDGLRKSIDDVSYKIRFSPRKPRSIWSAVNIRRAEFLISEGRMKPDGLKAFEARQENRSGIYSYEQRPERLDEPYASILRKNKSAHAYFESRSPSYRRAVIWWIISAKREETRLKRLEQIIERCANQSSIPQFTALKRVK